MANYVLEIPFCGTLARHKNGVIWTIPAGTKAMLGNNSVRLVSEGSAPLVFRMTGPGANGRGSMGDTKNHPLGVWWMELRGRLVGGNLEVEAGSYRASIGRTRDGLRGIETRVAVGTKTPTQAAKERRETLRKLEAMKTIQPTRRTFATGV